jgi:hypothetical protein
MQYIVDEYLEPRFRSKDKKRRIWSALDTIICFEDKISKKEEAEEK